MTTKQEQFVQNLARGMTPFQAAKAAGYSDASARKAHRLKANKDVAAAIDEIRQKGRELAAFDVATAMEEAQQDHAFAIQKGNANAAVKATELRCKLSGLLKETVEVVHYDMRGALEAAKSRVLNITSGEAIHAGLPIDWKPRIPGDDGDDEDGQAGQA